VIEREFTEVIVDYFHSEVIPEPPEPTNTGPGWQRTLMDIFETVLLSVVLFLGINAVSSRIRVESISMQPTLYAGNFVLVNRLAYKIGKPSRGDIIIFRYPPDPTQVPYIKRVIGLPGDVVHITDGKVYINGDPLVEPYLVTTTNRGGDWTVPANSLFVMGDNRNNSSDSRSWGFVPLQNVIGKAEVVYWPPQKWGLLSFPTAAAANP
jgi:signal peptidase I